jgi:hypothetical protein
MTTYGGVNEVVVRIVGEGGEAELLFMYPSNVVMHLSFPGVALVYACC